MSCPVIAGLVVIGRCRGLLRESFGPSERPCTEKTTSQDVPGSAITEPAGALAVPKTAGNDLCDRPSPATFTSSASFTHSPHLPHLPHSRIHLTCRICLIHAFTSLAAGSPYTISYFFYIIYLIGLYAIMIRQNMAITEILRLFHRGLDDERTTFGWLEFA